jgi:transketolase
VEDLLTALTEPPLTPGVPVAVVAYTVKGKGVSFMEGRYEWHGKAPNDAEYEQALKEIGS